MTYRKNALLMAFLLIALVFSSCTDLDEQPISAVTPDSFYGTEINEDYRGL